MQLSKKQKTFSRSFSPFCEFRLNFEHFEKKKKTLIAYVFRKLQTAKDVVKQMSKKSLSGRPFNKQHGKWSKTPLKTED